MPHKPTLEQLQRQAKLRHKDNPRHQIPVVEIKEEVRAVHICQPKKHKPMNKIPKAIDWEKIKKYA